MHLEVDFLHYSNDLESLMGNESDDIDNQIIFESLGFQILSAKIKSILDQDIPLRKHHILPTPKKSSSHASSPEIFRPFPTDLPASTLLLVPKQSIQLRTYLPLENGRLLSEGLQAPFFLSTTNDIYQAFLHYLSLYYFSNSYEQKLAEQGIDVNSIRCDKKIVSDEAIVKEGAVIGEGCYVGSKVSIGVGVRIERAVVLAGTQIKVSLYI